MAANCFHVTTTTGGVAFVLRHMEDYRQTEFTDLRVWLTSITEQWAVIAVQGPRAAAVLAPLIADIDLTLMPHMSVREGHIGEVPIRLFRVSFTGEAGFEINLPPDQAQRVWDTLRQYDVTPYGTDAMHVLRAEKGYIIVGQETDGTVTPDDVGLAWTISGGDFVGHRSLSLPDLRRPDRKQLVGLLPVNPATVLEEGAQVVSATALWPSGQHGDDKGRVSSIGHVTSAYGSATLGRGFALALVAGGRSLIGSNASVAVLGGLIPVTVTNPMFLNNPDRLCLRPVGRSMVEPLVPVTPQRAPVAQPGESVQLSILAGTTRLAVRAGSTVGTTIGMALGVLLPTVPCRSVISRDRAALWLGPDEWLIIAPEDATELAGQAVKAAGAQPVSVVDVSHRSRVLELTGPRAAWCLNGFCALDLDIHAFPIGMCTRTRFAKAEIVLWRVAREVFHLDVARSLVPYVWACLEEAWLEFTSLETVSVE
jgi:sarcosine oxidase subunit alpha